VPTRHRQAVASSPTVATPGVDESSLKD